MNDRKSLMGRKILITGANSGIGFETAKALAGLGADIIMVCRSEERGSQAKADLLRETPDATVELLLCDLSDQSSIEAFIQTFRSRHETLDVLVNNAGAYFAERMETDDGLERTFALNHMGYFLTAKGLLPALRRGDQPRIINVSSMGHRLARLNFDDLQWTSRSYRAMRCYCDTKLMNILFTRGLAQRLDGESITVNAVHPGAIRSGFAVSEPGAFGALVRLGHVFLTSPKKGARTSIFLASDESVRGVSGEYFVRCRAAKPSRAARNQEHVDRLWALSESLVRCRLD